MLLPAIDAFDVILFHIFHAIFQLLPRCYARDARRAQFAIAICRARVIVCTRDMRDKMRVTAHADEQRSMSARHIVRAPR